MDGPMLKVKEESFAKKMGHDNFITMDGWIGHWKMRHDIKFKKARGEKGSTDYAGADEWRENRLPELIQQYSFEDIYNADEI